MGKFGWMIAFIFCACTALRLARFNVMAGNTATSKRWFIGMPSPAAAVLIAGLIWVCYVYHYTRLPHLDWITLVLTAFAGISMVVNIPFWSFKEIHFNQQIPFTVMLGLVLAILFLYINLLWYYLAAFVLQLIRIFDCPLSMLISPSQTFISTLHQIL